MPVKMSDFDYWVVRGFGGLIHIIEARLALPFGLSARSRDLLQLYIKQLSDLNDTIQNQPVPEKDPKGTTTLATIDNWFVRGFTAMDNFIRRRSEENETRMSDYVLDSIQAHVDALQKVIDTEKGKSK